MTIINFGFHYQVNINQIFLVMTTFWCILLLHFLLAQKRLAHTKITAFQFSRQLIDLFFPSLPLIALNVLRFQFEALEQNSNQLHRFRFWCSHDQKTKVSSKKMGNEKAVGWPITGSTWMELVIRKQCLLVRFKALGNWRHLNTIVVLKGEI